ncbi:MAG: sigma-70 family RNA polymerase sigma factor [Hymenobacteraceae bacterium]|nr:sigma-70 family RNA polymerase sigma factor [Hymenobacteraceae bacterium]
MALSVVRSEPSFADVLARLRAGDARALDALYRDHRATFTDWAHRRYPDLADDVIADAFQEAVIVFYEHVMSGRLHTLTAAPSSYIFRLGARICVFTKKSLTGPIKVYPVFSINSMENFLLTDYQLPDGPTFLDAQDHTAATLERDARVDRALHQLSPDCKRILTGYYFDAQPLAALSAEFGHRDVDVTTVRKSQCLTRLRSLCGVGRA